MFVLIINDNVINEDWINLGRCPVEYLSGKNRIAYVINPDYFPSNPLYLIGIN